MIYIKVDVSIVPYCMFKVFTLADKVVRSALMRVLELMLSLPPDEGAVPLEAVNLSINEIIHMYSKS